MPAAGEIYEKWSPSEMMLKLGFELDWKPDVRGRVAVLVKPGGARFELGPNAYDRAHRLLSRVMKIRGISPERPREWDEM